MLFYQGSFQETEHHGRKLFFGHLDYIFFSVYPIESNLDTALYLSIYYIIYLKVYIACIRIYLFLCILYLPMMVIFFPRRGRRPSVWRIMYRYKQFLGTKLISIQFQFHFDCNSISDFNSIFNFNFNVNFNSTSISIQFDFKSNSNFNSIQFQFNPILI